MRAPPHPTPPDLLPNLLPPLHAAADEGAQGSVTIRFWRNGFTVDDGDVRSMEDPANKEFLVALDRGCVCVCVTMCLWPSLGAWAGRCRRGCGCG